MASKRKMQTQTAYQPYSFVAPELPPPRSTGVPDTSIASSIPQVNNVRSPQNNGKNEEELGEKSRISLPESEAQKSMPASTTTTPTTPTTPTTKAKPRPTLRARKAAMKLTPGAVNQLRALLNQPEPKMIKVGVRNKGCSGLAYHLEYVDKKGMLDEEVVQDGVKVIIDSKALMSIIGSEMDWIEDKLNQRFVFTNPNISKPSYT
jgi:iron-sulfur cluster assembly accessory protein